MGAGTATVDGPVTDRRTTAGTVGFFVLLTGLAAVVFWPSISTGFFIDDFGYFGVTLPDGWWYSGQVWDFSGQVLRPVTTLSIGLQQELFGLRPLPFHLLALAVLMVQGVLVYLLARRLGTGEFGARAAAALMVLHTTNGWTLMWTASTSSLYGVVFSLGVVYLLADVDIDRRQRMGAVVLYAVALLSREIAIMVPFIVVVVRLWRADGTRGERIRRSVRDAAPLFAVLGVFLALRLAFSGYAKLQPETPRLIPILDWASFSKALPMAPTHMRDILVLATSPFESMLGEGGQEGFDFPVPVLAVAAVFWVVVVALTVREARAGRYLPVVGLAWFLLGIFPPVFLQPEITYGNYADLALPGLVLAIAAIVASLVRDLGRPARVAVAVLGLALLSWVAYNGGNTLIRPAPPFITRAEELADWARENYPDPPPGSTIVVTDAVPEDPLWTSNGDLFRALYDDPTLQVEFVPAAGG